MAGARIAGDWPGQTKERQGRIQQAFRDGRFVVHALPFSLHTELFEPEDLVRGLSFSSRLCRGLGLPLPRDAKMTDVPCHSWILPTLLRHAGVEFLHLGCNPASSSPRLPLLFWWEGPDGSRLLTMYSAGDYGSGLAPPADWPYQTWLALIHTGDNSGPPRPREVGQFLEEAKRKLPGVSVRIGRMSDFADAIRAEHASIPVVRGDMPDTWVHGPMCDPAGAREARNLRPAIGATELLGAELAGWNAGFDPGDSATRLAAAREKSLLYGEHTWGGSLGWVVQVLAAHALLVWRGLEGAAPGGAFQKAGEFMGRALRLYRRGGGHGAPDSGPRTGGAGPVGQGGGRADRRFQPLALETGWPGESAGSRTAPGG